MSSGAVTIHVSLPGGARHASSCLVARGCTACFQMSGVVRELMKTWKSRMGSSSYEDLREIEFACEASELARGSRQTWVKVPGGEQGENDDAGEEEQ